MAKFVKFIPVGAGARVSSTSSSYVALTDAHRESTLITIADFTSPTFYFEATIFTSANTAAATLYDESAEVTSAEITTTSTSAVRVRSGAITPTTGDEHHARIKNATSDTTNINNSCVLAIQEANTIAATETQVKIMGRAKDSTSTSYQVSNEYFETARWLYTSGNFDGTVVIKYEARFKTTAGTGYSVLQNVTDTSQVGSSEQTTTSTSYVKLRSGSLTVTTAKEYESYIKNSGAGTTSQSDAKVIITQTDDPTKTESYNPFFRYTPGDNPTSFTSTNCKFRYDSTEWDVDTANYYNDITLGFNNHPRTGNIRWYAETDGAALSGSDVGISSTTTSEVARGRSSALTMPATAQDLRAEYKESTGTVNHMISHFLAVLVWTNTADFIPRAVII